MKTDTVLLLIFISFRNCRSVFFEGHLLPLGFQQPPSTCIEELYEVPQPKQFFNLYVTSRRPVVFRGAAAHSRATERWSPENLIDKYGDLVVRVEARYEGSGEVPMTKLGYGRDTIQNFASHYQSMNSYVISQVPSPMEGDVSIPPCLRCGRFASAIQEVHMFIVGKGGKTLLHRDPYSNIHCVFNGTKQWIMIADNQASKTSTNTKGVIFIKAELNDVSSVASGGLLQKKNIYESPDSENEFGGFSMIDVVRVDLTKHPKVLKIEYSKVQLNKGDCLFIPGGFWHQVNVIGEYNTAVSIWFSRHFDNFPQDWSNCAEGGHGFVPMSAIDVIWRFSGGNTSLTQGHMDVNMLRSILLMMADSNNQTSIKQFCRDLTDTKIEQDALVAKFKLTLNLSSDLVSTNQINSWSIELLKKLILTIDPSDPANHIDLEYYVIDSNNIRHFLDHLQSVFCPVSRKEFKKRYSMIGGSVHIAGQIFQILDHNRDDVITIDEVKLGYVHVLNKFAVTLDHRPGTERKWFNFLKSKGLL